MFRFTQCLSAVVLIGIVTFGASSAQAAPPVRITVPVFRPLPVPARPSIQVRHHTTISPHWHYYRYRYSWWNATPPVYANANLYPIVSSIGSPSGDSVDGAGIAALIEAQGRFLVQQQEANRAKIENRQRMIDVQKSERELRQKLEDKREPQPQEKAGLAQKHLPSASSNRPILSSANSARRPLELFETGRVHWPMLLRRADFDSQREELDDLGGQAIAQANHGEVELAVLQGMSRTRNQLENRLVTMARVLGEKATWSANEYIEAKQFLRRYQEAIKALGQPPAKDPVTNNRDLILTQIRK